MSSSAAVPRARSSTERGSVASATRTPRGSSSAAAGSRPPVAPRWRSSTLRPSRRSARSPFGFLLAVQVGNPVPVLLSYVDLLQTYCFKEQVTNSLVVREPIGVVAPLSAFAPREPSRRWRWSSEARVRSSCWTTPTWTRRSRSASPTASSTPARPARRGPGCSAAGLRDPARAGPRSGLLHRPHRFHRRPPRLGAGPAGGLRTGPGNRDLRHRRRGSRARQRHGVRPVWWGLLR